MSTSSELMYAILAMDAYNRGYNAGLIYEGNLVGTATVAQQSDISVDSPEVNSDFYAVAYDWINLDTGSAETTISYRIRVKSFVIEIAWKTCWRK